jgi:AsmA protein
VRIAMARVLKWVGISVGVLIVLIIALLLIVPRFVDINKYKPSIESMVTESTGRAFSIRGNIDLTLFPWAGVSMSNVHLGNAKGFKEKDFVSVEYFEVRVKLIPLIFKDLQVKRFMLKGPRIVLEKSKGGRGNWEGLTKSGEQRKPEKRPTPEKSPSFGIKNLMIGEFAITSGELVWIDHQKGTQQRLTQVNLALDRISFDQPIGLELSMRLNGKPLEIEGKVGPLGKSPGEGKIPILLKARALDTIVASLQGFLADLTREARFNMTMEVQPFSPRKLAKAMEEDISKKMRDPDTLKEMSLKVSVAGTPKAVTLKDGLLKLDDSNLTFDLDAKQFEKPVLSFRIALDGIDLDRYLPPSAKGKEKEKPPTGGTAPKKSRSTKPDYTPLRKLVMNGTVGIGRLKVYGATMSDVKVNVTARNGIIKLDPISMNLYKGSLSGNATLNVQEDTPTIKTAQRLERVQAGSLLNDLGYTDRLDGVVNFRLDISAKGTEAGEIRKSLNGSGEFAFTDGAIMGLDSAHIIRSVGTVLELAGRETSRTEFSDLKGNFTIKNGLLNNPATYLDSSLLKVVGKGNVDLAREIIDYRIEPKFVASLKKKGDTKPGYGVMVPIVISGPLSNPQFRPDLSGIVKDEALKEEASKLLQDLMKEKGSKKGEPKDAEKRALELLEGLIKKK